MNLIKVDIIRAKPSQAVVDRVHDVLAGEPAIVCVIAHRHVDLCRNDEPVTARPKIFQRAAENLFAFTDRIHVGGIEIIDSKLERFSNEWAGFFFFQNPRSPLLRAIGHGAKTQARYFQAGWSKVHIFHREKSLAFPSSRTPSVGLKPPYENFRNSSDEYAF